MASSVARGARSSCCGCAAWACGAHLHDIRQGLRTFSTSFFQAPGRLNLLDVGGIRLVIDYCHNVDGMRNLADFVERMMVDSPTKAGRIGPSGKPARVGRAIGVIGIPGDRRDDDQKEYGAIAATAFDEIIVREDKNLRGRQPGETASHVVEGVRRAREDGRARATKADKVLDEMSAVRTALRRAGPGDLVFKPRNQWHTFWNAGDEPCRILEIIAPAGFERFFEELSAMGGAIEADPDDLIALGTRYGLSFELDSVPELLERFGLRIGEPLAGGWTP